MVAGLVFGIVLLRRRTFVRKVLKIDLEAVSREAGAVAKQDFFKNIQDQLRKEQQASGDPGAKGKD